MEGERTIRLSAGMPLAETDIVYRRFSRMGERMRVLHCLAGDERHVDPRSLAILDDEVTQYEQHFQRDRGLAVRGLRFFADLASALCHLQRTYRCFDLCRQ